MKTNNNTKINSTVAVKTVKKTTSKPRYAVGKEQMAQMMTAIDALNHLKPAELKNPMVVQVLGDVLFPYGDMPRVRACGYVKTYLPWVLTGKRPAKQPIVELPVELPTVEEMVPQKAAKIEAKAEPVVEKVEVVAPVAAEKPEHKPFGGHSAGCGILYLLNTAIKDTSSPAKAVVMVNRAMKYLASEFEIDAKGEWTVTPANAKELAAGLIDSMANFPEIAVSVAACTAHKPVVVEEVKVVAEEVKEKIAYVCPKCNSAHVSKAGLDRTKTKQRINCKQCGAISVVVKL